MSRQLSPAVCACAVASDADINQTARMTVRMTSDYKHPLSKVLSEVSYFPPRRIGNLRLVLSPWWSKPRGARMAKTPILFCDDGSEVELPSKWMICSACQG